MNGLEGPDEPVAVLAAGERGLDQLFGSHLAIADLGERRDVLRGGRGALAEAAQLARPGGHGGALFRPVIDGGERPALAVDEFLDAGGDLLRVLARDAAGSVAQIGPLRRLEAGPF